MDLSCTSLVHERLADIKYRKGSRKIDFRMSQQTLFDNIFREFFCFRSHDILKMQVDFKTKEILCWEKIFSLVERKSGTGVSQPGTVRVLYKTTVHGT